MLLLLADTDLAEAGLAVALKESAAKHHDAGESNAA